MTDSKRGFAKHERMTMTTKQLYVWVLLICAFASGCPSPEGGAEGVEGGRCFAGGTCDDGLTCLSNHCVYRPARDASVLDPDGALPDDDETPQSNGAGGIGGAGGTGGTGGTGVEPRTVS